MSYFSTSWTIEIKPKQKDEDKYRSSLDSDQADYITNKIEAMKYELLNGPEGENITIEINYN